MELVVRPEPALDFAATAALAAEGFGPAAQGFSAGRLEWLYRRAFGQPTTVLGLFAEDRKVGQVALVGQSLRIGDACEPAVALMDLFILPPFRSREAISALYGAVERFCLATGIGWIVAVPNRKAAGVNRRYLSLDTAATLDIRAGVMPPWMPGRPRVSGPLARFGRDEGLALLSRYQPTAGGGLAWTADTLWERLQDPSSAYGLHATDDLLLVSSARSRQRMSYTLLCGFFARPGATIAARDVRAVTAAACRLHRRPLFVYGGLNAALPLPGWRLPERLRPSLMIVQARALSRAPRPLPLDRFELLDFDFA